MNDSEWTLTWGEHVWSSADWKIADSLAVRAMLDLSGPAAWQSLSPVTDPQTCVAFLAVAIARTTGVGLDEATAQVFAAPAAALVDALTVPAPDSL